MAAAAVQKAPAGKKKKKGGGKASAFFRYLWKHKYMYLMLLPAILFYAVFCYAPMYGATMAFKIGRAHV